MIIFASDTSTSHGSVAVRNADGRIFQVELGSTRPHSETLLPAVSEVLSLAGLKRTDVQALAVGTGPGAFTGLRVGLATFKGWASAAQLPVLAVSSLDAVAFPVLKEGKTAIVVADARKGEAYACYYPSFDDHGLPARRFAPEIVPFGDIPEWIEQIGDGTAVVLGTGVPLIPWREAGRWPWLAGPDRFFPSASHLLAIGEVMMSFGQTTGPSSLVPDYVRPPDARPREKGIRSGEP